MSAGKAFRQALADNKPLQIVGTINAYSAMMAQQIGHKAIYLSGGGVANASYGLPDLGMTSLNDVIVDVQRITAACDLPLMVDIDTGWGVAFNIAKTVKDMQKAGAAAVHMEDQVAQKVAEAAKLEDLPDAHLRIEGASRRCAQKAWIQRCGRGDASREAVHTSGPI